MFLPVCWQSLTPSCPSAVWNHTAVRRSLDAQSLETGGTQSDGSGFLSLFSSGKVLAWIPEGNNKDRIYVWKLTFIMTDMFSDIIKYNTHSLKHCLCIIWNQHTEKLLSLMVTGIHQPHLKITQLLFYWLQVSSNHELFSRPQLSRLQPLKKTL